MSNSNLARKLQSAAKAWKSFQNHLRSKLRNLRQHCASVFPFLHRKFFALKASKRRPHQPRVHLHSHRFHPSYSAIYVDHLFPGPVGSAAEPRKGKETMTAQSSSYSRHQIQQDDEEKGLAVRKGKAKAAGESSRGCNAPTTADKWKLPVLPQFRGIDDRAEEFIAKLRQDMKLERAIHT